MASGSAGPQPTSTLEAKMPIQDLDNALSQALQAAESAAKATTRGLKGALASCDVKTQKALEASQCSAQAAHESIKAARSTLKAAKLERRPWIAAYDSFMKKSHRYWRIKPKATNCASSGRGFKTTEDSVQLLILTPFLIASNPSQASARGILLIISRVDLQRGARRV